MSSRARTPPKRLEICCSSRKRGTGAESLLTAGIRRGGWAAPVTGCPGSQPLGDQAVDGVFVDPHDLVDLDLLARHVELGLAEPGDLVCRLLLDKNNHELRDGHHG